MELTAEYNILMNLALKKAKGEVSEAVELLTAHKSREAFGMKLKSDKGTHGMKEKIMKRK